MHVHARIHRWVVWWFYVGIICGVVALANILGRDLTKSQERLLLLVGVAHWLLGGIICYACEGIRFNAPPRQVKRESELKTSREVRQDEWHAASDFLLPGNRKRLLKDYVHHHHTH
jgi:hypothetical protein